jgi:hypothetical protein
MLLLNVYCFSEIVSFDIPIAPTTYIKELPVYFKKLNMLVLYCVESVTKMEEYCSNVEDSSDDSDSSDVLSPSYISPQKRENTKQRPQAGCGQKRVKRWTKTTSNW